jgi:diguanylate cyclase (GGDEF)-like protein
MKFLGVEIHRLIRWQVSRAGRWRLFLAASLGVVLIGFGHLLTGQEIEFHAFYLLPVGVVAWYAGYRFGLAMAVLSAADWLVAEFLLLPFSSPAWIPALNETLRLAVLAVAAVVLARLRQALDREADLARRDPLTRLYNRLAFEEMCMVEIGHARRLGYPLCAIMIDLDHFKEVNDTLGHQAGDALLRTVGRVLAKRTRASDFAGRLGGDEFSLVLVNTDADGARHFAEQMRDALLAAMKQRRWPVTFSIGVAVFPSPPDNAKDLLAPADALMYRAKEEGRDAMRFALQAGQD